MPNLTGIAPDTKAAPTFSTESAPPATATPVPASPPSSGLPDWLYLVGAAVLALLAVIAGLLIWGSRRKDAPIVVEFERPIVSQAAVPVRSVAPASAMTVPPPAPAAPAPHAPTVSQAVFEQDGLELALEARRMSASLMATTLSYRLTLTNRSGHALAALAIEGDMVAAHGQLPPERQVASRDHKLELRHALPALAPGESAEFTGDIRVPLHQITPIRSGELALFVPLARFRVDAGTLIVAQTFVIGESSDDPAAGLRPFRLDLGPRNYSRIGQRAVG